MENCTIYSHLLDFESIVNTIKTEIPKAKLDINDGGKQKSIVAKIKGGFFGKTRTLTINYRERKNPSYKLDQVECALTQNLAGMVGYIQSLPSENEKVKNKFLAKVMSANCEMAFIGTPDINDDFSKVLVKVLSDLNGFVFAQPSQFFQKSNGQHFLDRNLNLIVDNNGVCEVEDIDVTVEAKYHDGPAENYTSFQKNRKAASEKELNSFSIKVNKNLPCISSEDNTHIRSVEEVIRRAYALLIMAVKGEGVEQEYLLRTVAEKDIQGFTPRESYVFNADALTDSERAYATWRYESLYTLLWALGLMEELKYPSGICDVQDVVKKISHPSKEDFIASVSLKSKSEILDELDRIYRMNWACVDARIKGEQVAGGINPSVVYERHYALNWLTNHQNQEWDDVTTNT